MITATSATGTTTTPIRAAPTAMVPGMPAARAAVAGRPLVRSQRSRAGRARPWRTATVVLVRGHGGQRQTDRIFSAKDGVVLRDGACPSFFGNRIRDQTKRGIVVCAKGQGMLLENDISNSGEYNVEVRQRTHKLMN